jgi:hypothetical protein
MTTHELAVYEREGAAGLARLADRQLAAKAVHDKRVRVKAAPRLAAKAGKRAAKNAETAALRAACVARADGRGELCGHPLDMERAEMCHLDGGSGKRTQQQSIRNCVMEHHDCHQGRGGFDVVPRQWIPEVERWAERHGYSLPERFRKLAALTEAA